MQLKCQPASCPLQQVNQKLIDASQKKEQYSVLILVVKGKSDRVDETHQWGLSS